MVRYSDPGLRYRTAEFDVERVDPLKDGLGPYRDFEGSFRIKDSR